MPDTYWSGSLQKNYQFPIQRQLTMSFPEKIRLGDVASITMLISQSTSEDDSFATGCEEFCTLKHPLDAVIWDEYSVDLLFSFDRNNLRILPKGDTIIALSEQNDQQFEWQISAIKSTSAYIKSIASLNYKHTDSGQEETELIYARELTIPVTSIGPLSFPIFRIICIVWLLSSVLFVLLPKKELITRMKG
ncbi:MAG: hypothetical protein JEZ00_16250 [Anaerolineaceae bacterium]|nr:hypothetical protein [Anaerolineaceae bacterium]